MVDPSLCPIPPGFEVIDGFSDDFDRFKEFTTFDSDDSTGYSHRWKNSNITSANIVCGFQFRIGPDVGERWKEDGSGIIIERREVKSGDVSIHLPRVDELTRDRGGYIVEIKWYITQAEGNGVVTEGKLGKEIPHSTYGKENYFLSEPHNFRSQPNPRPNLPQAKDGNWHSILAVIYNDYYNHNQPDPTIGLWYCPLPTHDFDDFIFLGLSIDKGDMKPRGPLRRPVLNSDHPFKIEHALQIRIDDVPTPQVKIRNVYAAEVRYHGAIPPLNPVVCIPEAKAVNDAQVKVNELEMELKMLEMDLSDLTGDALEQRKNQISFIKNTLLPPKYFALSTAKFIYGECANVGFRRKRPFESLRNWLRITALDASQGIRSIMSSFSVSSIGQLIGRI